MAARFTAEQVLEQILSNVQQDNADSEEEVEDLSEEEVGEEPQHRAWCIIFRRCNPSEAKRETFLSKQGHQ